MAKVIKATEGTKGTFVDFLWENLTGKGFYGGETLKGSFGEVSGDEGNFVLAVHDDNDDLAAAIYSSQLSRVVIYNTRVKGVIAGIADRYREQFGTDIEIVFPADEKV